MTPTLIDSFVLRRSTTQDLPAIVGWFQDPDTSRFLGGPDWPAAMLANAERAVGTDFRGARQTAADHFLALSDGVPVGYVDCGTFDRCAVYGGEGQDGPIILETIEAITGAIGFTIDPARRREGLATRMIRRAVLGAPDCLSEFGHSGPGMVSHGLPSRVGLAVRRPRFDLAPGFMAGTDWCRDPEDVCRTKNLADGACRQGTSPITSMVSFATDRIFRRE